jgi:radical SAM superfamily enzyme YgiQ (UPF0313 family)
VVEEIGYWHGKWGVKDFVFYDDALLMQAERHALPILEGVIRSGLRVRFHTPNALHIRWLSHQTAVLMRRAGFETIRLGLEAADISHPVEGEPKVTIHEFQQAAAGLKQAGFDRHQLGAYLLVGLPGQRVKDVAASIRIVKETGIKPVLAHYTPIPHTALWPSAVASSRYDLDADPVFTNNAVFPCQKEPFSWDTATYLKKLAAA